MSRSSSLAQKSDLDAYFRSTKPRGPLDVKVGEEVAWTRYSLLQIGAGATDPMWGQRGRVVELRPPWALVEWDGEEKPRLVSTTTLAYPTANPRFCE